MTQDEIIEGNTLIAKFMEFEVYYKNGNTPTIKFPYQQDTEVSHYCKYHSDWNKLMEVLIKINKMGKMISINLWTDYPATECKIYNWEMGAPQQMAELENPLHAIWYAVVEFIKWLQKQQEK